MAATAEADRSATKPAPQGDKKPAPAETACHTCRFWLHRPHMDPMAKAAREGRGECRRYPPATAAMRSSQFGMTKGDIWCGEHAPAD